MIGFALVGGFVIGILVTWSLLDMCNCIRNKSEWEEAVRKDREP